MDKLYFNNEFRYIDIEYSFIPMTEIFTWCKTTFGPQYELWDFRHSRRFYFKHDEDYMLALLKWKE
jgi:hypothetical protein